MYQRQGAKRHHASQQVEAQQVEDAEPHREQDGAGQRLTGLHVDRDGEGGGQGQDGTGHEGADDRVTGGHEDFGFTSVDHLGDEFGRYQVGHVDFL